MLVLVGIAQERTNFPPKAKGDIQNRCMSITGATDINLVVEALLGEGITYSNVTYQGDLGIASEATIGFFSGANCVPLDINEGILLSSGFVSGAAGPNTSSGFGSTTGTGGDADLQGLIPGYTINDATWIQFDFIPNDNNIFIQYIFASEEYNEFVGSSFNDVFGFFIDGINIALIPGTSFPVAINNVNLLSNSTFYRNNDTSPYPFDIEADGMTVVLTATAAVTPGETHTIKIGVADAGDTVLDSWVFVKAESFSTAEPEPPAPIPISNWALYMGILLMITFIVIRFRRMV
jgi:hypothetical protein